MRLRGFEVAKGWEDKDINLPVRKTKYAAGYDFEAAEDTIIPSFKRGDKPTLIKTGIKAYMQDDEVLILANRSSNPGKKGLILANSVGIVDKDYYGNPDNDGHIMFAFYNIKCFYIIFLIYFFFYIKYIIISIILWISL